LQFFLAIINAFNSPEYFPEAELRSFSAVYIIDYLRKSHNYFINTSLPKIERLLDEFVKSSESADLNLIRTFYTKYKTELIEHIHDEEENTFPYVLELQKAYDDINPVPEHLSEYSIESFEKEHTNVDEKLFDLKNIIIKFLDPTYAVRQCNEFLFELFNFERELRDHARIEDQILVPKVMKMEDEIKSAI
jgi:regulator of cell morphogenesis and NO signaling